MVDTPAAAAPGRSSSTERGPAADFIDPATLMQIKSLELRAKFVVEGFWSGLNRSPHHGFSVEFTEYRQYVQGDDTRYLDWRLLARSDRLYIKRFEDETNLRCNLLLDTSRSMSFGSLAYNKAEYARTLAATLAYFLIMQRDAVGLTTFDEKLDEYIPARYRAGHMRRLMTTLERQSIGPATDLATPLSQIAERIAKRGMFILISDMMAPLDRLESSLAYLAARGNDILLFQVLDPAEVTLDFSDPVLFEDIESGREIYVDPSAARAEYQKRLEAHNRGILEICERLGASFHQFRTDGPLEESLSEVLRMRLAGRSRRAARTRSQAPRRAV